MLGQRRHTALADQIAGKVQLAQAAESRDLCRAFVTQAVAEQAQVAQRSALAQFARSFGADRVVRQTQPLQALQVRLLEGGDDPEKRKEALLGLARAASMIRRDVARRMSLRFAPELRFYYDEGQDKVERIEQLLDEVKREQKAKA